MSVKAILTEQQKSYTKAEEDALLATKQNTLTFDTTPTASSTNPVTSGGIATALDGRLPSPENAGAVGQVLTRTATGSVWQTQSSGGDIVAAASNSYAVTLYAASWSNQQQTIATPTGAEITSTSDGVLGLAAGATQAQVEAFQLAKIVVVSQSSSGVVVKAYGIVPTINLPCELMLFMKADYYNKDYIDTYMAPLDTPTFIGVPKAPTAAAGTNTTQIATTAFVEQAKNTRVPNYGMGKNLLRNWYFAGGGTGVGVFPVNQRGATSGTTVNNTYSIDAWTWTYTTSAGSWALNSTGLTLTPNSASDAIQMYEYLENASELNGKSITASILKSDGTLKYGTITRNSSSNQYIVNESDVGLRIFADGNFRIYAKTTQTIVAVKLELGTEQTLCHNEGTEANPVWVLNEMPNYEEELFKCSTSTADPSDTYSNKPNANATIRYYTSQAVAAGSNTTIMRIPAGSATDPNITTDTVVLDCTFAAPANITSNITWTSYPGYVNFVGSCSAATTANVILGRRGN